MKKKVLIIRFSSIGDIILTTPVIRCLHLYGDYEVHLLTQQKFKYVLTSNIYLSQIHTLENTLWKTSRKIQKIGFEAIVDLHKSLRSYPIRIFLFRKVYGFEKLRMKRWWRTHTSKKMEKDLHITLRFLNAIKPLGIKYDGQGLDFFIKKEEHVAINSTNKKHIALVPGARAFTKTIPLHLLHNIISHWADLHFHILGGEIEKEKYSTLGDHKNTTFHCGSLSLGQSASVLSQCDLVITTDTALMHIAAAMNKKIISIWGGTVPEFGFHPFIKDGNHTFAKVEVQALKCRPCSKSGKSHCPKKHFDCMNLISTEEMNELMKNLL